ncbi:hypothetical protein VHEMI06892 [[Torrubiella] hemipterigena]|uniref:Uncharacterized protein n=1 Tax=[Torrubiella] hemipterigena TaxID=1531966 RepID=A0A0A1TK99_9HYPO|nr:hypothetical protein VHEMI06892 [[Torrubiella] hemipterigena]
MPGRQAHGRPLIAAPKARTQKKTTAKLQKKALDAYGIAEKQYPTKIRKTPRARELDAEVERKHARDDEDEDDEDDEDEDGPSRKKIKRPARPATDDAEFGSDSEGNEWQLGGMAEDDEDSEIESDDAFGESDNERFQGYSFRGTKSKPSRDEDDDEDEDDSNDDEGETLGEEAIDLATALDQFEEESEEEQPQQQAESDSDLEEGSDEDDSEDEDDEDDSEEDEDEDDEDYDDPDKIDALEGVISNYAGDAKDAKPKTTTKQKISLGDLGLSGLDDAFMKKSVKLMNKEDKEKRPGAGQKLDVPLSRREQGRLDRTVAYDKTNETLERWTDTVKQNRRAEHLVFPLPENSASAGMDKNEIQLLSTEKPANELESTIMSIMELSGISMEPKKKEQKVEYDEDGNELSKREIINRRRLQRELNAREAKKQRRIKKIKSKAYHRVHRKEQERDDAAMREALEDAGEIDSEQERQDQDRRRALERVGQRHRESKWAKLGNKAKRAVWDEDYRTGLTEMARMDEELRRRKEGHTGEVDSDDTSSSGSDNEDDEDLRRQLDELEQEDDEPQSALMKMKFMQKAEAARKKANTDLINEIRRDLDGEQAVDSDEEEKGEVGRRQYGKAAEAKIRAPALDTSSRQSKRDVDMADAPVDDDDDVIIKTKTTAAKPTNAWSTPAETTNEIAGAWSRGESRKKTNKSSRTTAVDLNTNILLEDAINPSAKPKTKTANKTKDDSDSDSEDEINHPMAIKDQSLIARAFAGDDVYEEFAREKAELADEQDDQIIDNTIPGWGSWVGEGISNREKKRHTGRFLTKVKGVQKQDRKDAKLDKVIISEKRVKKNDAYLASHLPHPFESVEQYERSLRLPVGSEWMTKETFQENTKPRVIIKQGVITAMAKPSR